MTLLSAIPQRASIYELERISIRQFVESCAEHLAGPTLDFGCGRQPYRDVVEAAGGEYVGYDDPGLPGSVAPEVTPAGGFPVRPRGFWRAVLCTQVLQYVDDPVEIVAGWHRMLTPAGGVAVVTGPSSWHEEEPTSLWRWTRAGARRLFEDVGFHVERIEDRGTVNVGGFPISVGWGLVARA